MKLRQHFLTGLVAITPVALTGWILWRFFVFVDRSLRPLLERWPLLRDHVPDFLVTALGVLTVLLLIVIVGLFTHNLLGAAFFRLVERLFQRIPIVKGIFSITKQISEVLLKDTSSAFKQVVAVAYPREGVYAVGFVTNDDPGRDMLNVFLPTSPNPTSGFMLMVPRDEAVVLPLNVEEGIKLVVSGGSVVAGGDARSLDRLIAGRAPIPVEGGEDDDR